MNYVKQNWLSNDNQRLINNLMLCKILIKIFSSWRYFRYWPATKCLLQTKVPRTFTLHLCKDKGCTCVRNKKKRSVNRICRIISVKKGEIRWRNWYRLADGISWHIATVMYTANYFFTLRHENSWFCNVCTQTIARIETRLEIKQRHAITSNNKLNPRNLSTGRRS